MTVACYVDYSGKEKIALVMRAFAHGCGGTVVFIERPKLSASADDHAVFGMWPIQNKLIELVVKSGQKIWYIDNGWFVDIWRLGRQHPTRAYYRISRNGLAPQFLPDVGMARARAMGVKLAPWCRDGRKNVLVCLQYNQDFAKGFGVDYQAWVARLKALLPTVTDRKIVYREKPRNVTLIEPLASALRKAWCVVTHSSNAAVEAAMAGVPVFCEPTCGAAMVGCTDFTKIEQPVYPDNREEWIASLMWQQFSLDEMNQGLAWRVMNEGRADA